MAQQNCSRCGMEKTQWSQNTGVTKGGQTYCCQGCADNTGCTCG